MNGRDLLTDEQMFVCGSVLREEPCTDPYARICGQTEAAASSDPMCDRHASRLAGASPAMALGRREHVGEGKGARRNARVHLTEEGTLGTGPHGRQ
jgi:hypothetical protein